MPKQRKIQPPRRAVPDSLGPAPWAIEFANTTLSEENWTDNLLAWFGVSLDFQRMPPGGETNEGASGKKAQEWHYGGMAPTLAHIERTQESIRETLDTLSNKGTVPRDVVERVNSYLMGLHGFKFHIISDLPLDNNSENPKIQAGPQEANLTPEEPAAEGSSASNGESGKRGVQPQTLRLEPKTYDLRSLFYYRFSIFLISSSTERVRKCKQCGSFFIQRFNHRKLYCSDLCRFRSHNRSRLDKKTAKSTRKRTTTSPGGDTYVWWKKYEENPFPD